MTTTPSPARQAADYANQKAGEFPPVTPVDISRIGLAELLKAAHLAGAAWMNEQCAKEVESTPAVGYRLGQAVRALMPEQDGTRVGK
jgi:hypothetical protein